MTSDIAQSLHGLLSGLQTHERVMVGDVLPSAEEAAAAADRRRAAGSPRRPLDGMLVGVKDIIDVEGVTPHLGSFVHPEQPASADATCVKRLREAGAVVAIRTWTHEHAWGMTGQHPVLGGPANPWAPDRITGGSSAGSAALVALGLAPMALGTDTACSTRLPSAWCGVFGWKPTYAWCPLTGVLPLSPRLDHLGVLAASLDVVRAAHDALADQPLDASELGSDRPLRIASTLTASPTAADPAIAGVLADVDRTLGVPGVVLPDGDEVAHAFSIIQAIDALHEHRQRHWWPQRRSDFGADVEGRFEFAESLVDDDERAALAVRQRTDAAVERLLRDVDVVVSPIAGCAPPLLTAPDDAPAPATGQLRPHVLVHSTLQAMLGLPALVVPVGTSNGLPVGIQIWSARNRDAVVLRAAAAISERLGLPTTIRPSRSPHNDRS